MILNGGWASLRVQEDICSPAVVEKQGVQLGESPMSETRQAAHDREQKRQEGWADHGEASRSL